MPDRTARRLVALLGRLQPGARIAIRELAESLDVSPAELASDLLTLSVCGLPPFAPDTLMPLIVEDGYVEVWSSLPTRLGTVRLSQSEAAALASALQTAGLAPEHDLVRRLLDAVASASFDPAELTATIRAATSGQRPDVHATIALGRARREVVRIEYQRMGEERATVREIEPVALFVERGTWYTTAWCHSARDWRTFRIDRMRTAELTGTPFSETRTWEGPLRALPLDELPRARLRFVRADDFTERDWPGAQVVEAAPDGSLIVSVPDAGTLWLARRVLSWLGAVEVLEPAQLERTVARLAAEERAALRAHRRGRSAPNRRSMDSTISAEVIRCTSDTGSAERNSAP